MLFGSSVFFFFFAFTDLFLNNQVTAVSFNKGGLLTLHRVLLGFFIGFYRVKIRLSAQDGMVP